MAWARSALILELFHLPLFNLLIALGIAIIGAWHLPDCLKVHYRTFNCFIKCSIKFKQSRGTDRPKRTYWQARAIYYSPNPSGLIEIDGKQYEAHAEVNYIERGKFVFVCSVDNFKIDVKEIS